MTTNFTRVKNSLKVLQNLGVEDLQGISFKRSELDLVEIYRRSVILAFGEFNLDKKYLNVGTNYARVYLKFLIESQNAYLNEVFNYRKTDDKFTFTYNFVVPRSSLYDLDGEGISMVAHPMLSLISRQQTTFLHDHQLHIDTSITLDSNEAVIDLSKTVFADSVTIQRMIGSLAY